MEKQIIRVNKAKILNFGTPCAIISDTSFGIWYTALFLNNETAYAIVLHNLTQIDFPPAEIGVTELTLA